MTWTARAAWATRASSTRWPTGSPGRSNATCAGRRLGGSAGPRSGADGSHGLADELDLTDFPTNVFVVVPDASTPAVPREIRKSDLDTLQTAWDCMMKGKGLTLQGTADDQRGFRELLRGGLADSPLTRGLFRESPATPRTRSRCTSGAAWTACSWTGFNSTRRGAPSPRACIKPVITRSISTTSISSAGLRQPSEFHVSQTPGARARAPRSAAGVVVRPGARRRVPHVARQCDRRREPVPAGAGADRHQGSQPAGAGRRIGSALGFLAQRVVALFETWHISGRNITSIDYSP